MFEAKFENAILRTVDKTDLGTKEISIGVLESVVSFFGGSVFSGLMGQQVFGKIVEVHYDMVISVGSESNPITVTHKGKVAYTVKKPVTK